ncbi:hypothetical protein N9023_04835 [Opitutaceae bacterium]|nr:hypothetical protein [Opitutaceae bacterium]
MDNEFTELETELQQLTPAQPSAGLMDRLQAELGDTSAETAPFGRRRSAYHSATNWNSWKWANWTVAAGLAIVMTLASWWAPPNTLPTHRIAKVNTENPADLLRPVRAARMLVESRPEGVIELPDGSPVERVRDYYIDTIEWRDGAGDAQLRWELPRESVRFVALNSY